jgi:hypothetical protein
VPDNLYPTPRTLTPAEIDSVIAYLQARVLADAKSPTRIACIITTTPQAPGATTSEDVAALASQMSRCARDCLTIVSGAAQVRIAIGKGCLRWGEVASV